jgi:hypothetical protein
MGYWIDYSAAKLTAQQVLNAGHSGVIRYIDSPDRLGKKHTNKAEYDNFVAAGLPVLLVFEVNVNDADGGWNQGVAYAQRAKAGADYLGYKGPIFFCNDKTTVSNSKAWTDYLDGAASVLGIGRIGAYGFSNAVDSAKGHAAYFWQSGRWTDVRPHVHIWQDNNVQVTVGGISCDRNKILKDLSPPVQPNNNSTGKEEDMALTTQTFDPTYDKDKGEEPKFHRHTFVAPTNSRYGTIYQTSWLTVKCAWGSIEEVYVQCVDNTGKSLYNNTFKDIPQNLNKVNVQAPDGTDQYNVQIISNAPYSICIEGKIR